MLLIADGRPSAALLRQRDEAHLVLCQVCNVGRLVCEFLLKELRARHKRGDLGFKGFVLNPKDDTLHPPCGEVSRNNSRGRRAALLAGTNPRP